MQVPDRIPFAYIPNQVFPGCTTLSEGVTGLEDEFQLMDLDGLRAGDILHVDEEWVFVRRRLKRGVLVVRAFAGKAGSHPAGAAVEAAGAARMEMGTDGWPIPAQPCPDAYTIREER